VLRVFVDQLKRLADVPICNCTDPPTFAETKGLNPTAQHLDKEHLGHPREHSLKNPPGTETMSAEDVFEYDPTQQEGRASDAAVTMLTLRMPHLSCLLRQYCLRHRQVP
jgi:hypothetical protein